MKRDGLDEDMSYDYIELNSTANLGPDDTNKENTFAITPLEAAFFQADDTGDN
ncbi:jg2107, partial [Pararge aegeria aegeria]